MSDIASLTSQIANASHAAQAKAAVRPEAPPPLTAHSAVAQTLNTPQTAVLQAPTADGLNWRRETNPDEQGDHAQGGEAATPTLEQLEEFLAQLNERLRHHRTQIRFEAVHQDGGWQIRIVDRETRNLVRWISWQETRAFARALEECGATRHQHGALSGYAAGGGDEHISIEGGLLRVKI